MKLMRIIEAARWNGHITITIDGQRVRSIGPSGDHARLWRLSENTGEASYMDEAWLVDPDEEVRLDHPTEVTSYFLDDDDQACPFGKVALTVWVGRPATEADL